MPTLKLRFPGGRYHATPWGHHVNEGLIEWPPSPWRLLRALLACGFSSQGWTEIPLLGRQLVNKLAEVLPSYHLPQASVAHSRHFMPMGVLAKGREQTSLVFDTWANVGDEPLFITWPCILTNEEAGLLDTLATSLGYLGRSESWVQAEFLEGEATPGQQFNALPHYDGLHPGRDYEQVSLVASLKPQDYAEWQQKQVADATKNLLQPAAKKKLSAKAQRELDKAIAPFPVDLLACLTKDTSWWKQHGWSQPPGSQRVLYWRRCDSLQVTVPQSPSAPRRKPVTAMLLALTTQSGNRSALPPCSRTLPQAELFHRAIVGRVAKGAPVRCPELTGKDDAGQPLHENHGHAHTLPLDLDCDGHLDHLLIYAPLGLREAAQRAIRSLRVTWAKKTKDDIQLAVVGSGDVNLFLQLPPPLTSIGQLLREARVWKSVTPFVPPRFLKPRGKNTLLGQVNAELASRRLPLAQSCDVDVDLTRKLRHYVRRRQHGGPPPFADIGLGLKLVFEKPVPGPLSLGYASHYGLGLFGGCPQEDSGPDPPIYVEGQ